MIDNETMNSLAQKLDGLELTSAEAEVLDLLYSRAAAYEEGVVGFAQMAGQPVLKAAGLTPTALRLGAGIGSLDLGVSGLKLGGGGRPERGGKPERS